MKSIYLDQFQWINLAKAQSEKADGSRYAPALAVTRRAVHDGRACFPISAAHIKETAGSPRVQQRRLLAQLMAELSQGVVLRTPRRVVEHELKQAVRRTFGLAPLDHRFSALGRGVEEAFNFNLASVLKKTSPEWVDYVRQTLDSPAAWIDLLTHSDESTRLPTLRKMSLISEKFACGRQDDRQLLSDNTGPEVRRVFVARVTLHFREALQVALKEVGKGIQDWGALGPERLVDFWFGIPCVRTLIELEEAAHFEKSRVWKANDLHDLEFLGLAIPSCNVVGADKFFAQHVKRRKLDQEFKTIVFSDLTELVDIIESWAP